LRSEQVAADDLVLGEQLQHLLEPMIASLPVKLRDPLTLSTVEELSPRDISQVLGINEAAVRSRLFRARQILKEKLAGRLTGRLGERHGT
jgi:RNA polymerase sigma-70 factor (ECF subfamily)